MYTILIFSWIDNNNTILHLPPSHAQYHAGQVSYKKHMRDRAVHGCLTLSIGTKQDKYFKI
jgi:hypothetical protein